MSVLLVGTLDTKGVEMQFVRPKWKKVLAETEKNGRLLSKPPESVYMNPTDYSPLK